MKKNNRIILGIKNNTYFCKKTKFLKYLDSLDFLFSFTVGSMSHLMCMWKELQALQYLIGMENGSF